jgi:hypothetical protein
VEFVPRITQPGAATETSRVDVALTQTRWLAGKLPADITSDIALDGGYGNLKFFSGVRGVRVFATPRMCK